LGILVALAFPGFAQGCGMLGSFFVSALKAVAPVLVFVLVAASIANQESTTNTAMKDVIVLYLVGTFLAALVAVFASFLFPTQIALIDTKDALSAPGGIGEVVKNLIFNIVDNPVKAIANANYIGILAWSISLGVALRYASDETKRIVTDLTASVEYVVRFVIRLAPIGVFGLVAEVVATTGLAGMMSYVRLLAVLIGCMIFIALIVNPLLVFLYTHKNPYPLVWACLRESGITAFFTRSSAANIPVNMNLCRKLGLDEKLYSLSIPIGATINMDGTAIMQVVATVFIAGCAGYTVTPGQLVVVALLALLASVGTPAAPGAGAVILFTILSGMGFVNDGALLAYSLILAINRPIEMLVTSLNVVGDAVASICVAKSEGLLNEETFNK